MAGIEPPFPPFAHHATPLRPTVVGVPLPGVQDRLAGWVSDLTALHDLTEALVRTRTLHDALRETVRAGAHLVGARRGLATLEPPDGQGPVTTVGLGLARADIGHLETVPRSATCYGRILDALSEPARAVLPQPPAAPPAPGPHRPETGVHPHVAPPGPRTHPQDEPPESATRPAPADRPFGAAGPDATACGCQPDILAEADLDPRLREVAGHLGYAASYAVPLDAAPSGNVGAGIGGPLGAAVWLFDEPAEPSERQRHLVALYRAHAAEHLARLLELHRQREAATRLQEELLPRRLPRTPGVRLAVRHSAGSAGGGDWYDALPLPEGALGLAVGAVTGSGPGAVAAMGRLRAGLRAYAVMEGEDPVAVLSDLELLMRLTEPARSATALFAFAEPAARRVLVAGAGHCPPLLVGESRTEFVETSLSAPLGMLACWEAPSVQITPEPGETLLLYSDGLVHRTGDPMDRAFARLHAAACSVPRGARDDAEAVLDHVVRTLLPEGLDHPGAAEDVVVLAATFDS